MWCNFSREEIFGFQPVKVLETELITQFEKIRSELDSWFPAADLNKINLDYKIGKYPISGPRASSKNIQLSETFLSSFWNYCFGLTFATPFGNTDKGDVLKFCNPYDSLAYCRSLFKKYNDWDLEKLPNPELQKKELMDAIHKVNRIYSVGLYFIIFHEFAHIVRGDIYQKNITRTKHHEMEFACDSYALEIFASSTDLNDPEVMIGLFCATGLLTFSSSFDEKFTEEHPFPDERLLNILKDYSEYTNVKENNNVWILATWILATWDFLKNKIFLGQENSIFKFSDINDKNLQTVFDKTFQRLQAKKIWTNA